MTMLLYKLPDMIFFYKKAVEPVKI